MSGWQPRHTRAVLLTASLLAAAIAVVLVLLGLGQKVTYFYAPSDILRDEAKLISEQKNIRLGGLVENGSLKRTGTHIVFTVTDLKNEMIVTYEGVPPDLFREGQGVVAEGVVADHGAFTAHTLLAKHDEKYMPPEVARSLHDKGIKGEIK